MVSCKIIQSEKLIPFLNRIFNDALEINNFETAARLFKRIPVFRKINTIFELNSVMNEEENFPKNNFWMIQTVK